MRTSHILQIYHAIHTKSKNRYTVKIHKIIINNKKEIINQQIKRKGSDFRLLQSEKNHHTKEEKLKNSKSAKEVKIKNQKFNKQS